MRKPDYRSEMPIYIRLIIILGVIFLFQCFLGVYGGIRVDRWFELSLDGILRGYIWQLLTYQFLHMWPWPWHLLFNCIGLFFLGRAVQDSIGKTGLLQAYFSAGFAGGILQLLAVVLLPVYPHEVTVVGASAGVYGLLGAFAALSPMKEITVFLYFIPITVKARTIFWVAFGFAAFYTFFPKGETADAAHLGGLLMGVAYIRWFHFGQKPVWLRKIANMVGVSSIRSDKSQSAQSRLGRARPRSASGTNETTEAPDFIASQVDPILDKISEKGLHSLTDKEREILEKARKQMGR